MRGWKSETPHSHAGLVRLHSEVTMADSSAQDRKRAAAERAVEEIRDGMVVGLGTGSTAELMVEALARRVASGLRIVAIPTSDATEKQARALGIAVTSFAEHPHID